MIVDVWAQVPTARMAAKPWFETLARWNKGSRESLTATVPNTLAAMDAADVRLALLSAWSSPSGALISNEELTEQIDQAPDRFRGLISVDLRNPMQAVREIRQWTAQDRIVGVRVLPWVWDLPPDDRRFYPVYVACIEAGIPFCTQIGHTGPLMRSEVGRPIPYLENVLLDFPELVIVGGHVGFPWINELTSLMFKFPNLYVDTSAYALHRLPPDFIQLMKGAGGNRIMFGTNWPMLSPSKCLQRFGELGLSDEQSSAFLAGNAQRVFKLNSIGNPSTNG
jgi:predicted TIM-barrel fold metal-dependent hydrolase